MERAEGHCVGVLDDGDHEPAGAVLADRVHRETEIHATGIHLEVVVALLRHGPHH